MFYRRLKNNAKEGSWLNGLRRKFFRTLTESSTWDDFHIADEAFAEALFQLEPFSISQELRTFFCMYAMRFDKPRWGDKTPFYSQYLPWCRTFCPRLTSFISYATAEMPHCLPEACPSAATTLK
jgi:hypothetical protein